MMTVFCGSASSMNQKLSCLGDVLTRQRGKGRLHPGAQAGALGSQCGNTGSKSP